MNTEIKSNAACPDLDWSQVRETILMLTLATTQIQYSMRDGDDSVETLTDSFTSMVGNARIIALAAEQLEESEEKETISKHCSQISDKINAAIVAFQFYDKLTQRMEHVTHSLKALSDLVGEPSRLYSPFEWQGLQEKIKSKYTVASDKQMFEAVLKGATVDEALEAAREQTDDDDIELF